MENPGIDRGTSHMLSERSTTWANSPVENEGSVQLTCFLADEYIRKRDLIPV